LCRSRAGHERRLRKFAEATGYVTFAEIASLPTGGASRPAGRHVDEPCRRQVHRKEKADPADCAYPELSENLV
jgi:hypothetical protein